MLFAYRTTPTALELLSKETPLSQALWVDLFRPMPAQAEAVEALGVEVPTLADMEEIEVSNRLYRRGDVEVLTVVLPGVDPDGRSMNGPVAFLLTPERIVTVRYHTPKPFETFPLHAANATAGFGGRRRLFLGLMEEIIARLADLSEGVGREIDRLSHKAFAEPQPKGAELADSLRALGRQNEHMARYRQSLLSLERALSVFELSLSAKIDKDLELRQIVKAQIRDIQALMVHGDFLSGRIAQLTDVTLGLIDIEQAGTGRVLSVVAILFLPPTLIASIYGMNFSVLPGVESPYGWIIATVLMLLSALGTLLFGKWRGWL